MNRVTFRALVKLQQSEMLSSVRVGLLRGAGISIGKNSTVGSNVNILTNRLSLGDNVRVGVGSRINNYAHIEVDEWVRMGSEVHLETATHKIIKNGPYRRTTGDEIYKPIIIERGCMIYARVMILPGVVIREGCVIGAGSIIDKSTEKNGLYVGIRPREPLYTYPS